MKKIIPLVGLIFFLVMAGYFILFNHQELTFGQLNYSEKAIIILGVVGGLGFWLMMLSDFFCNRKVNHRVIWGFGLFFLSWLAAIIYYFVYFVDRKKINDLRE